MKTNKFNIKKHKSKPLVLFFSSIRSSTYLKAYKDKSETISLAVKEKLQIKLVENGIKEYALENIKNINGCFYGVFKYGNRLIEKKININHISKAVIGNNGLQIMYAILW